MLSELKNLYQSEKKKRDVYVVRYMKALTNHLARLLDDSVDCDDVDIIFTEICFLYNENKDCSFEFTKCFSLSLYYMFQFLVIIRKFDPYDDEPNIIYNMLHVVYKQSDPHLRKIIGDYIDKIHKIQKNN
jgi:hypothetical protein